MPSLREWFLNTQFSDNMLALDIENFLKSLANELHWNPVRQEPMNEYMRGYNKAMYDVFEKMRGSPND